MSATKQNRRDFREGGVLLLYIIPCVIFVFIFSYLPLRGWAYAFYNYKPGLALTDCEYVGMEHFTRLFVNPVMRANLFQSLTNTFIFA